MSDAPNTPPHELTPEQAAMLDGFVEHYKGYASVNPRQTAQIDQVAAYLRTAFDKTGLSLRDPREFFTAFTGLMIGIEWTVGITLQSGLAPEQAADNIRAAMAELYQGPEPRI